MNIDNRISLGKIKKVLTPKIVVMALLITLVVSTVFYITLENNDKNEINIWYISEDNYDSMLSENLRAVEEYIAAIIYDHNYLRPSYALNYKTPIEYRSQLGFD